MLLNWLYNRLYHELAILYEVIAAAVSLGGWGSWRRAALPHLPAGALLELGPGPAELLRDVAASGYAAVGLERSAPMVAEALRRSSCVPPTLVQGDGRGLPFADGRFQCVLATFPAPYILEEATLREVARVLQPGGTLLVIGLWVEPIAWRRRAGDRPLRMPPIPLFYAPRPDTLLERLQGVMAAHGLAMTPIQERVTWPLLGGSADAVVGGLLAQKRGEAT